MDQKQRTNDPAKNPDPITKAPGSHPVGTGVGAAAGGAAGVGAAVAAGAAMGSVVGPVGTAVGAAVGAVAGGLIGKGVAEGVNPTAEHEYWRKNYTHRPYVAQNSTYDQYAPAYQYGWEARQKYADKDFDDIESDLGRDWERAKGKSQLKWDAARQASRDAWERVSPERDEE
jgi:ABC-type cobalamin transport system ATPase subunit